MTFIVYPGRGGEISREPTNTHDTWGVSRDRTLFFVLTVGFLGTGVPGVAQQVRHVRPAQQLAVGDEDLDESRHGAQVFGGTRGRRVGPQQRRSHAHAQVAGRHQVVCAAPRNVVQHAQEVAQQMVVGSGQLIDDPARGPRWHHKQEKKEEAVKKRVSDRQSTCRRVTTRYTAG